MRIKRDRFGKGGFAPALLAGAAMALALPSAGLAVVSAGLDTDTDTDTDAGFAQFTPAQVDPALAIEADHPGGDARQHRLDEMAPDLGILLGRDQRFR